MGNAENYLEVDMGHIEEEELPFMIIDKDTGRVYDTRNEMHVERLSTIGVKQSFKNDGIMQSERKSLGQSAWGDWWKQKNHVSQEFLSAAEFGQLEKLRSCLDKDKMQDMVVEINFKGLDQWTALHFAADSGHLAIIEELVK